MEQCPIKEMEILFECVQDTENSLFEPIPAKKVRPEWFKKLPISVDNYGKPTETIKKCPAMHDWLSMGYLSEIDIQYLFGWEHMVVTHAVLHFHLLKM